jgi:hypothetical protein
VRKTEEEMRKFGQKVLTYHNPKKCRINFLIVYMFFELLIPEVKINRNYWKGVFNIAFSHIQGIHRFKEFLSIKKCDRLIPKLTI